VADIFLSYKREDRDRAQRIERALSAQGWDVFWDHELLPSNVPFRVALAQELEHARCVLVLWSHRSVESGWVLDEATQGQKGDKLVCARIDDVGMPFGFGQLHAADLIEWNGDAQADAFQQLVLGIAKLPGIPSPNGGRVDPPPPPPPPPLPSPPPPPKVQRHPALRPTLLLAAVFLFNLVETRLDGWLTPVSLGVQAGYPITEAFRWFEGYLSFASHDATSGVAAYGYSLSYFFGLPLLCGFVIWHLARSDDPKPYRALSLAVAINYAVSLPFFIFFPVPERWSFFESEAMLLSDKWSDRLIEAIRPISGLDNSFPSNHVSLIVLAATASLIFAVPFRKCTIPLGATVVVSTFVLGVHWLPDMLAGLALGIASILLAWRLTLAGRFSFLWGAGDAEPLAVR
jgi:membrane-associated phospholipid phosphatase